MEPKNILTVTTRAAFRDWLVVNHDQATECWIVAKKGKKQPTDMIWYLDAVEEGLCFGWIDTIHKSINEVNMQKFISGVS